MTAWWRRSGATPWLPGARLVKGMLLAIDTSTRYAGVALSGPSGEAGSGGGVRTIYGHSWYSAHNHTVELMPAVSRALTGQGLAVKDLSGVAVALGPGGFSALRVGMSVAKGLALAAGIPLVGVGTLDVEAYPYLNSGAPVCAVLDSGRGEVASALIGPDGRRMRDDAVGPAEDLPEAAPPEALFCGEGVINWGGVIEERFGPTAMVMKPRPSWRVWSLGEIAWQRLERGETSDPFTLQPTYLRLPSIGAPKRRDWHPQGA